MRLALGNKSSASHLVRNASSHLIRSYQIYMTYGWDTEKSDWIIFNVTWDIRISKSGDAYMHILNSSRNPIFFYYI